VQGVGGARTTKFAARNPKFETISNDQEEKSDNSPPRRGERGEKSFLFEKYSELCELCTTMVESFRGLRKFSSGHPDYLGPEENSPPRRGVRREKNFIP
jgi:hypothetical protein